jgi:hypothetical protein
MAFLTPSTDSVYHGRWPSGSYLQPEGASGTQLLVADRLYFTPLWVPEARTTDGLYIDISAAGSGGSPTLRLGIYLPDANGRPGARLVDAGTAVATGTGFVSVALSQSLSRGLHWMACAAQGASSTQPTVRSLAGFNRFVATPVTLVGGANRSGYHENSVSGALPATATPTLTVTTGVPHVLVKAA